MYKLLRLRGHVLASFIEMTIYFDFCGDRCPFSSELKVKKHEYVSAFELCTPFYEKAHEVSHVPRMAGNALLSDVAGCDWLILCHLTSVWPFKKDSIPTLEET